MKLTRGIAMVLCVAFLFGAITPGFARPQGGFNDVPSHVTLLPLGDKLSDEELAATKGEIAPWIVGGIGGAVAYGIATKDQEKDAGWVARGVAAVAVGALTGGVGSALVATATTTAAEIALGTYTVAKGALLEYALSLDGSK